jgi:hypothetical protein
LSSGQPVISFTINVRSTKPWPRSPTNISTSCRRRRCSPKDKYPFRRDEDQSRAEAKWNFGHQKAPEECLPSSVLV